MLHFQRTGLGIGCVIRDFVKNELQSNTLVEIPLKIAIQKREIGFAYNKDVKISKSLAHFIQFYEEYEQ